MEHKTLKFRPHLVDLILKGEKTVTWRLFDDKDVQVGDIVDLLNWDTKEKAAEAEITKVIEKRLGDVTPEDYIGHEDYASQEEMLNTYRQYYGDAVTLDSMVKMITFKVL